MRELKQLRALKSCKSKHLSAGVQVKYEIVSEEELEKQRKQFQNGELKLDIEEQEFNMRSVSIMTLS